MTQVRPRTFTADEVLEANRSVHAVEAAYYDRIHSEIFNRWQQLLLARDLRTALSLLPAGPRRVLDVGCGTGNIALRLHARGHCVDAVDLSPQMLSRLCAKQPADEGLRVHCTDADAFLASAGRYDLITFSSVLHHLPDYVATLSAAASALNDGGVLLVTHEPLPADERRRPSLTHSRISRLGGIVDGVLLRIAKVRMPAIDYSVSDLHVEEGISPRRLVDVLASAGIAVVRLRRYRPERLALAALLNNAVLRVPPTQFALLGQRIHTR